MEEAWKADPATHMSASHARLCIAIYVRSEFVYCIYNDYVGMNQQF